MSVDEYLKKIAPWGWVTHTARGILSYDEFYKYEENTLHVYCRDNTCQFEETLSLSVFYEEPFLICSSCGGTNVTGEWMEYDTQFEQLLWPDEPIEGFPIDSKTDPFYGILYHIHYQRDAFDL